MHDRLASDVHLQSRVRRIHNALSVGAPSGERRPLEEIVRILDDIR
jgi:hypothetical protein